MLYPGRPVLETLPQFVDTNVIKPTPEQRAALLAFVAERYRAGRSLRELAELTGRTQRAVRRALDQAGVPTSRAGGVPGEHPPPRQDLSRQSEADTCDAMLTLPQPLLEVAWRHTGELGKIH